MIGDLSPREMDIVLRNGVHGHLSCCFRGVPSVVPIFYAYEPGVIYGHTYEGEKVRALRKNTEVCFQVDDARDIFLWKSVLVRGIWEELRKKEILHAVDVLSRRLGTVLSEKSSAYITRDGSSHVFRNDGRQVVLYGIRILEMTGRFERS